MMLPRVAVVDPELTFELPPAITASTGLDALTQLIEPFVSSRANAMTDLCCREGLRRVARSLRRAYKDGTDVEARTDMAFASLLGGLALANAGLGIVHGFAAPIGGMFDCASRRCLCSAAAARNEDERRCFMGARARSSVAGALRGGRCDTHGWRSSRGCDRVGVSALP